MNANRKKKSSRTSNTNPGEAFDFRLIYDLVIGFYLVLMLGVLPFYMTDGYNALGTDKARFYAQWSVWCGKAFLVVLIAGLIYGVIREQTVKAAWETAGLRPNRLSITEVSALAVAAGLGMSYALSSYRGTALWGEAGWYIGMAPQLFGIAFFLVLSRISCGGRIALVAFPASLGVFLLGILNGLGIYPIDFAGADESKISTIGNRNWYCGYLVSIAFIAIPFLRPLRRADLKKGRTEEKREAWVDFAIQIFLRIYLAVAFVSLITQGSDSGYLALLAVAAVLLLYLARGNDPVPSYSTDSRKRKAFAIAARIFLALGACMVAAGIILLIWNTASGGKLLGSDPDGSSIFFWNGRWGSNRGATFEIGAKAYAELKGIRKLFGVGSDCFYQYLTNGASPDLLELSTKYFGRARLTNAHSEYLTILVDEGLFGAIAFLVLSVTAIVRFLRSGFRGNRTAFGCGLSLVAITANNLVSFRQTMTLVTFYAVLGFGERALAEERKPEKI